MVAVVLCGGNSSRMGSDKGLLSNEAGPWAKAAEQKLRALGLPVKISINSSQQDEYSAIFPQSDIIIDNDQLQIGGPLKGLMSSHLLFPADDIFLLACDMPQMHISVLEQLHHVYNTETQHDAYVFTNDGASEPLCGIYKKSGLSKINSLYNQGRLEKHSLKFLLDQVDTKYIMLTEEQRIFFKNVNTHADLNGL